MFSYHHWRYPPCNLWSTNLKAADMRGMLRVQATVQPASIQRMNHRLKHAEVTSQPSAAQHSLADLAREVQNWFEPIGLFLLIVMANPFPNHCVLLLLLTSILSHVAAICFRKNGTDRNGPPGSGTYKPGNPYSEHSMCCSDADHYRTDGLCTNSDGSLLWRESCTDQTWTSSSCVNLCVSGIGEPYALLIACLGFGKKKLLIASHTTT